MNEEREALRGKALAAFKAQRWKKLSIGAIVLSIIGIGTPLIFASVASPAGFTAKIDFAPSRHQLLLHSVNPSKEEGSVGSRRLIAPGTFNARPTKAKRALDFYSSLKEEELSGVRVDADSSGSTHYALVYTFYLENASVDVDESFAFYVSLVDKVEASKRSATDPLSYLRLVIYANVLGEEAHHTFFAAPNSLGEGTYAGGSEDLRECISEYEKVERGDETLRKPLFHDEGEGYCEAFRSSDDVLVAMPMDLGRASTMRISILAYFEGYDPDCVREAPSGAKLSLLAHIGEPYA